MRDVRPYPWLGCSVPPKFIHGDCGQLLGCDDPLFDLGAERARRRERQFERDLTTAIETGEYAYRSSCLYDIDAQEAIAAVGDDPTPKAINTARRVFRGERVGGESVVIANGVDMSECRMGKPESTITRFHYWDGTPGLSVNTFAVTWHCHRDSDGFTLDVGNVAIRTEGIYRGAFEGLHRAGIIGDIIKSRRSGALYECQLIDGSHGGVLPR